MCTPALPPTVIMMLFCKIKNIFRQFQITLNFVHFSLPSSNALPGGCHRNGMISSICIKSEPVGNLDTCALVYRWCNAKFSPIHSYVWWWCNVYIEWPVAVCTRTLHMLPWYAPPPPNFLPWVFTLGGYIWKVRNACKLKLTTSQTVKCQ